jgi:hypothetical protein
VSRLTQPWSLAAIASVLAVVAFHLWIDPANPPGFIRDEASISYNAYTVSQTLRDQDGGLLPLYFTSFGDYKSPVFVYLLAGVFRVTGPHAEVARGLAALCVLAAVLAIGLIARRRFRSTAVAVCAVVLAGATPWLFELGRVAYETSLLPVAVCLVLLALESSARNAAWTARQAVLMGLALGLLTYVYAAGRLLAVLFAAGLIVVAGRGRWGWLLTVWTTFAVTLVPLAAYWHNHPGALSARYEATTFIHDGMPLREIVTTGISNYVHDLNLWHWVTVGDPKPYVHAHGTGSLLGVVAVLALIGMAVVLLRARGDLFWRYVLVALVLAPVPAAITKDRFYALRLVPVAVLLLVLAIPALSLLATAVRTRWLARVAAAALAIVAVVQFVDFVSVYRNAGTGRAELFEAGVPELLKDHGLRVGGTVFVDRDDRYAETHALWYAARNGVSSSHVVVLAEGEVPPADAIVFGRLQSCDYVCREVARSDEYWIALAVGPRSG